MSTIKKGKYAKDKNIITTPKARLAFASLHEPREDYNGDPKYQATFLFDESEVDLSIMRQVAKDTLKAKNPKAVNGFDFDSIFRDGDEKDLDGYAGKTFVTTKANVDFPPVVFDQKIRKVDKDEIPGVASGDYVVGLLRPYAWQYKSKIGVSFGLVGVQLVEHGERFAGGKADVEGLLEEYPIDVDEIDDMDWDY